MTKIHYSGPREYNFKIPLFDTKKQITDRVKSGLENVLSAYVLTAQKHAQETDNNVANYAIENVYIVGSGARCNRVNSDMDLLLVTPDLDQSSANSIKAFLQLIFFADRSKREAIDVYLGPGGLYPDRAYVNVTSQVQGLLNRYNGFLISDEPLTEEIPVLATITKK